MGYNSLSGSIPPFSRPMGCVSPLLRRCLSQYSVNDFTTLATMGVCLCVCPCRRRTQRHASACKSIHRHVAELIGCVVIINGQQVFSTP